MGKYIKKGTKIPPIEVIISRIPKSSRWIVLEYAGYKITKSGYKKATVLCLCKCGNKRIITVASLTNSKSPSLSCGCYYKELRINNAKTPGSCKALLGVYRGIMKRCYDPNHDNYIRYGGAGVTVCDEWRNNYAHFVKWARQNNWQKGKEIDKDIIPLKLGIEERVYSPDRCLIVTRLENMAVMKGTKCYKYLGEMLTIRQLSNISGFSIGALRDRISRYGWSIERAMNERVNTKSFIWNRKNKK